MFIKSLGSIDELSVRHMLSSNEQGDKIIVKKRNMVIIFPLIDFNTFFTFCNFAHKHRKSFTKCSYTLQGGITCEYNVSNVYQGLDFFEDMGDTVVIKKGSKVIEFDRYFLFKILIEKNFVTPIPMRVNDTDTLYELCLTTVIKVCIGGRVPLPTALSNLPLPQVVKDTLMHQVKIAVPDWFLLWPSTQS